MPTQQAMSGLSKSAQQREVLQQLGAGFVALGDAIFYYRPRPPEKQGGDDGDDDGEPPVAAGGGGGDGGGGAGSEEPSSNDLDLVILCTWFAAAPRHMAKYTAAHRRRHPRAALLVLPSVLADVVWRPNAAQHARLAPAVAVVQQAGGSGSATGGGNNGGRILLHLFSNGGAHTACQLAAAYRAQSSSSSSNTIPISALAIDSSPGRPELRAGAAALTAHLARRPLLVRVLARAAVLALLGALWVLQRVLRAEDMVSRVRRQLNDESLFPKRAPRCYLYSRADRMVRWRHVVEHADEAERQGWRVERVEFVGSAHAGHVLEDEEKYWGGVRGVLGM